MRQLKLAILSVHTCPLSKPGGKDTGGMNVYVNELAISLGKQGHSVDVFTRLQNNRRKRVIQIGENARVVHIQAGPEKLDKLAIFNYLPEFTSNLEDFRNGNKLEYDVIFSHYWLSGVSGTTLQQIWHVPHLVMFHTLGIIKNSVGSGENEPQLRIESEKSLVNQCDRIVASTEHEKEFLLNEYDIDPEKVTVVPCGVNLERFKPKDKTEAQRKIGLKEIERVVLFVGRIERIKAIDRLIVAVSLVKNVPDIKLLVVGGDRNSHDEVRRLKAWASGLGIEKIVHFRDSVPQSKLSDYYSAADVLVLPSYAESFGMVALEALACGTPVIANNVGDLKNIIRQGETGYVVENNMPGILAEKISLVLTQNTGSVDAIRASVSGYDWDIISEQIIRQCENELLVTGRVGTA
jgi:D-inositol-3-phosphate glycosyltransferase